MKNKALIAILLSTILLVAALLLSHAFPIVGILLCVAAFVPVGLPVVRKALWGIGHGMLLDENFLMTVATIGAFAIGEYHEGAAVMLFYQVGEYFQARAVGRSRASIAALMSLRPDKATVLRDGVPVEVSPRKVTIDETILVGVGERIPLDGVVLTGDSYLDTSALTGEPVPRAVHPGEDAPSGCINTTAVLTLRVTKAYADSTVNRILTLVQDASSAKSRPEQFISRFAKWYTPLVVIVAVLLAIVPPLLPDQAFTTWLYRALTFLVVSCPCALVVSVPLSFFGGIGGASRAGILVKGGNYLEALAHAELIAFDKTGTLTEGSFLVQHIEAIHETPEELLRLAAHAEAFSTHPIARSVLAAYDGALDTSSVADVSERSGQGVLATVNERRVLVGNIALMVAHGISCDAPTSIGTMVHVAADGTYLGYLLISDRIKEHTTEAIAQLKKTGIQKTVMLTGDRDEIGKCIGAEVGVDAVHTELLPEGKVEVLQSLLSEKSRNGTVLYVGDGINDAPVLALADVGIAMGGLGSDAAIEAADVVIMNDSLAKLPLAIRIARRTIRIANQNIRFALLVKVGVLVLSALGFVGMWAAVFADVGVCVLTVLNAFRALRPPKEA